MPERSPEPPRENKHEWEELKDPELDPSIREDLYDFLKTDWADERGIMRRLKEENYFAPSVLFGFRLLLDSHGLDKDPRVLETFDTLSKDLDDGDAREQMESIRKLREYFLKIGFSENEVSAPEILHLAYFGFAERKMDAGFEELERMAAQYPSLKEAYERFDSEARKREGAHEQ